MFAKATVVCLLMSILGSQAISEQTLAELTKESSAQNLALQKCKEYSKVYESPNECNSKTVSSDVEIAKYGEFPYMAGLYHTNTMGKSSFRCIAVLISPNYILTPAYCTTSKYGGPTFARFGYLNTSTDELGPHGQEIKVSDLKPHPNYNLDSNPSPKGDSKNHDNAIALIKLEKSVELSKYVHPICLQTEEVISGKVMGSGWSFKSGNELLKGIFEIYPQDECREIYKEHKTTITDGEFCVGSKNYGKCESIQQASVQIKNDKVDCMDSLVGLINYGPLKPCNGTPDVFTKIFPYIKWIESVVWE